MPKPAQKPNWVLTNAAVRTEPSLSKKDEGWNIEERPAREYMNWLFFNLSEWVNYVDDVGDTLEAFNDVYSAIVGTLGPSSIATHADLNAVMADGAVGVGARILVLDSATIDTTQQITKNMVMIEFQPKVTYTKGTATLGLEIQADGVTIKGGRFLNYSGGGDKAMSILAGADNAMVRDTRYKNCTTEIEDLASNSSISGTLTEI
jgi:hypothetical protein